MRVFTAVALQCAEIIGVAEFLPQPLEFVPITLRPFAADLLFQMMLEVRCYAIIIEQRVVHVEQENDFGWNRPFGSFPFHPIVSPRPASLPAISTKRRMPC